MLSSCGRSARWIPPFVSISVRAQSEKILREETSLEKTSRLQAKTFDEVYDDYVRSRNYEKSTLQASVAKELDRLVEIMRSRVKDRFTLHGTDRHHDGSQQHGGLEKQSSVQKHSSLQKQSSLQREMSEKERSQMIERAQEGLKDVFVSLFGDRKKLMRKAAFINEHVATPNPYAKRIAELASHKSTPVFEPHSSGHRGLYLYGPVGQGKTMLLDLFHSFILSTLPEPGVSALRCHFVDLMLALHECIHQIHLYGSADTSVSFRHRLSSVNSKRANKDDPDATIIETSAAKFYKKTSSVHGGEDITESIAQRLVDEGLRVLLIDEIQITNISDAMLFRRLAETLFHLGVVLVLTSNCPPEKLYEGGLNRERFLPFIETLKLSCNPIFLDTHHDFRISHPSTTDGLSSHVTSRMRSTPSGGSASTEGEPRRGVSAVRLVTGEDYEIEDFDAFYHTPSRSFASLKNEVLAQREGARRDDARRREEARREEARRDEAKRGNSEGEHAWSRDVHEWFTPSMSRENTSIKVFHDRCVPVLLVDEQRGSGICSFRELCEQPRSPTDFIGLSRTLSRVVWLVDVPTVDAQLQPETAKRFISLIDVFYDRGCLIRLEASKPPLKLLTNLGGVVEAYEDLWNQAVTHHQAFHQMWKAIFHAPEVSAEEWMTQMQCCEKTRSEVRLTEQQARLILKSVGGNAMSEKALHGCMCYHLVYGMAESKHYCGAFVKGDPVTKALELLYGYASIHTFKQAALDAQAYTPIDRDMATTSDVIFSVPRLISRLTEIAKPPSF